MVLRPFDHERRHPPLAARRIDGREDEREVGDGAEGNEALPTFEPIASRDPPGDGLEGERVGPGARLAQGVRADEIPGGEPRKESAPLLLGSEAKDRERDREDLRGEREAEPGVRTAASEPFHDENGRQDVALVLAARVLGRKEERLDAEASGPPPQFAREAGAPIAVDDIVPELALCEL